jgi:hypothetical protein
MMNNGQKNLKTRATARGGGGGALECLKKRTQKKKKVNPFGVDTKKRTAAIGSRVF